MHMIPSLNAKEVDPLIPAVHATSKIIAEAICQTGFAMLSSRDKGFYGRTYFDPQITPAIIIAWLCPGRIFPVVEDPNDEKRSLAGKGLEGGFVSSPHLPHSLLFCSIILIWVRNLIMC